MDTTSNTAHKPTMMEKAKATVHNVVDKVSHPGHKTDKQVHKEAEVAHKETAGAQAHAAVDNLKGAAVNAKDALAHKFEKNKHEGGEKVYNTRAQAANRVDPNSTTGTGYTDTTTTGNTY